jgi:hypothetical protein
LSPLSLKANHRSHQEGRSEPQSKIEYLHLSPHMSTKSSTMSWKILLLRAALIRFVAFNHAMDLVFQ